MSKTRTWIERQFVTLVVKTLLDSGAKLSIDRSEDGKSQYEPIHDASDASIDEITACDDERLYVDLGRGGWVYFVYGNDDGWYVISDYTTNLEAALAPINKLAVDEDMEALIAARSESSRPAVPIVG